MNSGLKLFQPFSLDLIVIGFVAVIKGNFTGGGSLSCHVSALSNRISVSSGKPVELGLCSSSRSILGSPTPEQIRQLCCEMLPSPPKSSIWWQGSNPEPLKCVDAVKADSPLAMTLDRFHMVGWLSCAFTLSVSSSRLEDSSWFLPSGGKCAFEVAFCLESTRRTSFLLLLLSFQVSWLTVTSQFLPSPPLLIVTPEFWPFCGCVFLPRATWSCRLWLGCCSRHDEPFMYW